MNRYLYVFVVVALIVGFFLGTTYNRKNTWTGIYYPNKDQIENKKTWILSPPLQSLEECKEWVNTVHSASDTNYDFQCGRACRYTTKYRGETFICETDAR